eukprot:TRINITY_DN9807_c0_g1_i2.p1 TRINITY_DN9807_c0_g1~~TRINITY_DN9807_c0_g1_i2.p1  ORF type:complete len:358 (+),score=95.49 TRINITY_DN9807_c0_g1_i2:2-1075(+)
MLGARRLALEFVKVFPLLRSNARFFAIVQAQSRISQVPFEEKHKELFILYEQQRNTLPLTKLVPLVTKIAVSTLKDPFISAKPEIKAKAANFIEMLEEQIMANKFTYKDSMQFLNMIVNKKYLCLPTRYFDFIAEHVTTKIKDFSCKSIADTLELLTKANSPHAKDLYALLFSQLTTDEISQESEVHYLISLLKSSCVLARYFPEWKKFIQPIEERLSSSQLDINHLCKICKVVFMFEGTSESFCKYIGTLIMLQLHNCFVARGNDKVYVSILSMLSYFIFVTNKSSLYNMMGENMDLLVKLLMKLLTSVKAKAEMKMFGYELLWSAKYGNHVYYELLNSASAVSYTHLTLPTICSV